MTDTTESPTAVAKANLSPGGQIAALVPQSLDDAFRLAKALAMSGDMVPKHFQGKPEATMAAIVRGMEIGLAPMQALSNIAVINGRASIWGDALPALLQRAGHHLDVEMDGAGDERRAVATLTRGDTGRTVTRTFSVADAKKAGLWAKQGPWQQYPERMLAMRARSFAVRDGAADALMGLQVAEETSDYQPIKDVTPREPGPLAKMAMAARGKPVEAPVVTEAEVMPPETQSAPDSFPGTREWDQGRADFISGTDDNPYEPGTQQHADWKGGYDQARQEGE